MLRKPKPLPRSISCCSLPWQDLLGINVTYSIVTGQVEAFFSVAGCLTPNNSSDRGCGPEGPSVAWILSDDRQGLCPSFWFGLILQGFSSVSRIFVAI